MPDDDQVQTADALAPSFYDIASQWAANQPAAPPPDDFDRDVAEMQERHEHHIDPLADGLGNTTQDREVNEIDGVAARQDAQIAAGGPLGGRHGVLVARGDEQAKLDSYDANRALPENVSEPYADQARSDADNQAHPPLHLTVVEGDNDSEGGDDGDPMEISDQFNELLEL
jgi:hypothetical protein